MISIELINTYKALRTVPDIYTVAIISSNSNIVIIMNIMESLPANPRCSVHSIWVFSGGQETRRVSQTYLIFTNILNIKSQIYLIWSIFNINICKHYKYILYVIIPSIFNVFSNGVWVIQDIAIVKTHWTVYLRSVQISFCVNYTLFFKVKLKCLCTSHIIHWINWLLIN